MPTKTKFKCQKCNSLLYEFAISYYWCIVCREWKYYVLDFDKNDAHEIKQHARRAVNQREIKENNKQCEAIQEVE